MLLIDFAVYKYYTITVRKSKRSRGEHSLFFMAFRVLNARFLEYLQSKLVSGHWRIKMKNTKKRGISYREDVLKYAAVQYGTQAEYPWASSADSAVLRH